MSQPHTRPSPDQMRGPERFASQPFEQERPSLGKAVGAGLALLALVVGVPLVLWLLTGPPPIPTGVPTRGDLTEPLQIEALFVVLRAVVWLAWLQFVVCTVVEVVSLLRGGVLPRPVPLSGRTQALARALVGTILIGGAFLGSTGAANAVTPGPETTVSSVQQGGAIVPEVGGDAHEAGAQGWQAAAESPVQQMHIPGVPSEMTDVIGRKVVIVQPPEGHYHDNLWDIAEKHLNDGRRWKQIYELNKGRPQPDGQNLVLGRLIQPGWVLIMPDDAVGAERVTASGTAAGSAAREAVVEAPAVGVAGEAVSQLEPANDLNVELVSRADLRNQGALSQLAQGGMVSATLLGALLLERRRRRSRLATDEELETEVELRIGADTDRAARLDAALRSLARQCRTEQVPLPAVYAVTVADSSIDLHLAPPSTSAPAPWSVLDDGARWQLLADAELVSTDGPAPYPALVCLGRDDEGRDRLLDLNALGGILSVGGAAAIAREMTSALAVQLAASPWVDEQVVHGYHLEPTLTHLAQGHISVVEDLGDLVGTWSGMAPSRPAGDLFSGGLPGSAAGPGHHVVLGQAPSDPAILARLTQLAGDQASGVGIVAAVPVPGARWIVEVDDAGRFTVPLLDVEVSAVRLTADAAETLASLFTKARQSAPLNSGDRARVPLPPREGKDDHWSLASVRVGVLGQLDLRTTGQLDPTRVALAAEIATFLALEGAPVHRSVVGATIWPGGVSAEVRDATINRVRDWLGQDAEGNHLLRENEEGRLYLSADVAVDWHAFCTLVLQSRASPLHEERELLRRALQLVRGEVLMGRPSQRFAWLARTRLERQAADVVVDTTHRLVELSLPQDPAGGAGASRAGLRLAPTSQILWRDLLVCESQNIEGLGVDAVLDEMRSMLRDCGAVADPETEALIEELNPGQRLLPGEGMA